jgi:hypothetical protein
MEMLAQVEWQQGCQQIEGEEQREIRYHHLPVIPVPKFLFHDCKGKK